MYVGQRRERRVLTGYYINGEYCPTFLVEPLHMHKPSISDCGYNHEAASHKTRRHSLPFTECPAHIEPSYVTATQCILHIHGLPVHNPGCQSAVYSNIPRRNLDEIHEKNGQMFCARLYPGQPVDMDESKSAYRWIILCHSSRSLYRQYNHLHGVNVTEAVHVNIDEWLKKDSPRYNPSIAPTILHYSARADRSDHFEACIAMTR